MNQRSLFPIQLNNISLSMTGRSVLSNIHLTINSGEIIGLLGKNGSGKSTLLSILAGLRTQYTGEVLLGKQSADFTSSEWRRRLGVVFQTSSCDLKLTAEQNLHLAALMYGLSAKEIQKKVSELLKQFHLYDRKDDFLENFSGGMKRKLDIARALLPQPHVLLLDEPTSGLDEASYQLIWKQIKTASKTWGMTVIVATHRPDESEFCDKLAILNEGKVIAFETPAALKARILPDMIEINCEKPDGLLEDIQTKFHLDCHLQAQRLLVECKDGHHWIPKLVETFPGVVQSISLRQADMRDVFLKVTGESLGHFFEGNKIA